MKYAHYANIDGRIRFVSMAHWGPNLDLWAENESMNNALLTDEPVFNHEVIYKAHVFKGELHSVPIEIAQVLNT